MNKLKKYHCYTSINNLESLSKYKVSNVKVIDEQISFYCDKANYNELVKTITLEEKEIRYSKLVNILKKHLITILGLLLITIALINQSNSIVGVRFTNTDTYNEEILNYLNKYYKTVGPFHYLNEDLTTINTDLRKTFYQYEWIGVSKNGSYLYLDIKEINNPSFENDPRSGSYYAKYDGIVKRYHLEKGIVLVQEEQYVAKGEKIISGAIPYQNQEIEYIRAKGYVIAEVLQYKEFRFPKTQLKIERTGKMIPAGELYIFNKRIGNNKNTFSEFVIEENNVFNLFNIIKKKDVYYYETKNIKNVLSEEDAINYAKSLVEKEFRAQKVNPFEKIIFNELVKIEVEDNDYYYIKLIVKTYQNIAEFIPDEIR